MNLFRYSCTARFVGAVLSFVPMHVSADIFEVSPADVSALVAAIDSANANSAPDTIILKGRYELTSVHNDGPTGQNGLPRITTPITLNGNGAVIVASGPFRIFDVDVTGSLHLTNVTVSGGMSELGGGGVRNDGRLVIAKSTFRGNRGGEGGAVQNSGTAIVWQSTFVANSAGVEDSGGAIRNDGTMSIVNSTFTRNTAFDNGGAIRSDGAIAISNATFVGNDAGFGGGAIQGSNAGEVSTIKNVILASNMPQNCVGVTVAQGDNFDTDGTCGGLVVTSTQLRIGVLANNGGATRTHALSRRSVAIDAVQDCTTVEGLPVTIDQRGVDRPRRKACDAGSFEAERH